MACDGEHALDDLVDGEVGAEFFFIEVEEVFTLFFSPVGDFPGLEVVEGLTCFLGFVFFEFFDFVLERFLDALVEVFDELEGVGAGFGHAPFEGEVGEIFVSKEGCFFLAELEDLVDELGVVVGSNVADGSVGAPDFFSDFVVIEVLKNRLERRGLEGEAPLGVFWRA